MRRLIKLLGALLFASNANAALVTIDPDLYSAGADVSAVSEYARLSAWSSDGLDTSFDAVVAVESRFAPSGDNVFGHVRGQGTSTDWRVAAGAVSCAAGDCTQPFNVLRVDFVAPTNYVELWSTADYFRFVDGAFLYAFGVDNSVVGGCFLTHTYQASFGGGITGGASNTSDGTPCGSIQSTISCADPLDALTCYHAHSLQISSQDADIAYLAFGGFGRNGTAVTADRLTFDVTEPSAGLLMIAGLLVLVGTGLQRRGLHIPKPAR